MSCRSDAQKTHKRLDQRLRYVFGRSGPIPAAPTQDKTLTRLRVLMIFVVGTVLSAGFYLIGLDYWLLVGAFVGVAEIVPSSAP